MRRIARPADGAALGLEMAARRRSTSAMRKPSPRARSRSTACSSAWAEAGGSQEPKPRMRRGTGTSVTSDRSPSMSGSLVAERQAMTICGSADRNIWARSSLRAQPPPVRPTSCCSRSVQRRRPARCSSAVTVENSTRPTRSETPANSPWSPMPSRATGRAGRVRRRAEPDRGRARRVAEPPVRQRRTARRPTRPAPVRAPLPVRRSPRDTAASSADSARSSGAAAKPSRLAPSRSRVRCLPTSVPATHRWADLRRGRRFGKLAGCNDRRRPIAEHSSRALSKTLITFGADAEPVSPAPRRGGRNDERGRTGVPSDPLRDASRMRDGRRSGAPGRLSSGSVRA